MKFEAAVLSYEITPAVETVQAKYVENFTEAQKSKIEELRSKMGDNLKQKIHNDFYLSKWLVAKKWDLNAATTMLKAHFKWMEEWKVDQLHQEYNPPELLFKYVPIGFCGDAKNGAPLVIYNVNKLDIIGMYYAEVFKEFMKAVIYGLEYGEKLQLVNSEKYGSAINNYTIILDMDNFRYKDYLWKSDLLRILEGHFPGIIGKMFIINVSRLFTMFYGLFKPFLRDDTKSRIFIFTKTDPWKEAVLEHVDKEQLPVHWGGTRVDDIDGNPFCSSLIPLAGRIPQSYYKNSRNRACATAEFHSAKVKKRETFTVDVEISEEGCTLTWSFWTEEYDIGFGVNKGTLSLVPVRRYQCEIQPEKGSLQCQESGTYTLIFDNTFSIFKSKKLSYEFQIIPAPKKSTSS